MTITAYYAAVVRLFALTGVAAPAKRTVAADLLCTCPEDRLVRAVAWYARESARGVYSHIRLCDGLRAIAAGWDDCYEVSSVERGSRPASLALGAGVSGVGVAIRPARSGKWAKPVVLRQGTVRGSVDLAAAWLALAEGHCTIHEDCLAHPELGAACADDAA